MTEPLRVFVGYDEREAPAYQVCVESLQRHASVPVEVTPLVIDDLNDRGLYTRPYWRDASGQAFDCIDGKPFSTDFSFTRFLVPAMMGYSGRALFIDSDMLFRGDVAELFSLCQGDHAVWCVQHNFQPTPSLKMRGGIRQEPYRRKAWSAVMVFDCGHPLTGELSVWDVNHRRGLYLHSMEWAQDAVGALPEEWHWLQGHSSVAIEAPKLVHFTSGTPDVRGYEAQPFADEWLEYYAALESEAAD